MVTPVLADPSEDPIKTGTSSGLAEYAGDYVTEMLGRGQALGSEAYNAYMGPLTAGASDLQTQAFQGLGNLSLPTDTMGVAGYTPQDFTGANVQQYMNPYLQASLNPQLEEARRQAGITAAQNANKFAGYQAVIHQDHHQNQDLCHKGCVHYIKMVENYNGE